MEMTLIIGEDMEIMEIPPSTTINHLLKMLDINSETVVVKKNNKIVMEEELINEGDIIEVIKVIYGG